LGLLALARLLHNKLLHTKLLQGCEQRKLAARPLGYNGSVC
jgi:hypothetical protein